MRSAVVLLKGGGDLASGAAHAVVRAGPGVVVTEIAKPKMVRREVSFGNAVYRGAVEVEGVRGILCSSVKEAFIAVHRGEVAVLADPTCSALEFIRPAVLVDAVMAKRNTGTRIYDAPVVIALGPGFEAGRDCHAVVETLRGENLGKVLYRGHAAPPTGIPAQVQGYGIERVLRAPEAGIFRGTVKIGDPVKEGDEVARVFPTAAGGSESAEVFGKGPVVRQRAVGRAGLSDRAGATGAASVADDPTLSVGAGAHAAVMARISGVVRGLLADGLLVGAGQKVGDIDPSGRREDCFVMSDKARAVGRGVVEALRTLSPAVL